MKRPKVNRVVEKTFRKCKSAGHRLIHQRTNAELSKRNGLKCVMTNKTLKHFNVKFTNKAKPQPVKVKGSHKQQHIDLVDMKSMKVEYKGESYRYILSLLGCPTRKEEKYLCKKIVRLDL